MPSFERVSEDYSMLNTEFENKVCAVESKPTNRAARQPALNFVYFVKILITTAIKARGKSSDKQDP